MEDVWRFVWSADSTTHSVTQGGWDTCPKYSVLVSHGNQSKIITKYSVLVSHGNQSKIITKYSVLVSHGNQSKIITTK